MKVKLICGPEGSPNFCFGLEAVDSDGRSDPPDVFVQSDWDYPGLASSLGWSVSEVQKDKARRGFDYKAECGVWECDDCGYPLYPIELDNEDPARPDKCPECGGHCSPLKLCRHEATDGTVDCKECGTKTSTFLPSAYDWLAAHDGDEVDYNP